MEGYYHPVSLPVLDNLDSLINETACFPFRSSSNLFCVGDQVCLDPIFSIEQLKIKVIENGGIGEDVDKVYFYQIAFSKFSIIISNYICHDWYN